MARRQFPLLHNELLDAQERGVFYRCGNPPVSVKLWKNLEVARFLRLISLFRDSRTNYVWVLDYTFEVVRVLPRQVLLLCVRRVTLGTRGFSRVRREFFGVGRRPRVIIDLTETGNRARIVSGTQGNVAFISFVETWVSTGAPNDGFLLNTLKSLVRLLRVLLDL